MSIPAAQEPRDLPSTSLTLTPKINQVCPVTFSTRAVRGCVCVGGSLCSSRLNHDGKDGCFTHVAVFFLFFPLKVAVPRRPDM